MDTASGFEGAGTSVELSFPQAEDPRGQDAGSHASFSPGFEESIFTG
jgi:hypothetical protein